VRITTLSRGGLSVFGGLYDPHKDEAVIHCRNGETLAVTVEYGATPSAITISASGITTTTPAISGTRATFTLSGMNDGGHIDIMATVNGSARLVRIRARSQTMVDRYCFDDELQGP
jgi:hypothetical protein